MSRTYHHTGKCERGTDFTYDDKCDVQQLLRWALVLHLIVVIILCCPGLYTVPKLTAKEHNLLCPSVAKCNRRISIPDILSTTQHVNAPCALETWNHEVVCEINL